MFFSALVVALMVWGVHDIRDGLRSNNLKTTGIGVGLVLLAALVSGVIRIS